MDVERYIFDLKATNKYKSILLLSYSHFCKANGIVWHKPELRVEPYPVRVPTEERIDRIISSSTKRFATIFQLSKHGLRPDEISKITLRDLDLDRGTLRVRTSKLGLGRTVQLKPQVRDLLREYVSRLKFKDIDSRIFPNADQIRDAWSRYRRRAYEKFKDPELLKVRLYDLRHWFATTEYLRTRDVLHLKYLMGHRNIQSTLMYVHLSEGLMNYSEDYICKVAGSLEEAVELVEAGFEYVTDFEGKKLFRKRK
ncbi:site-specific integrase [Candidatus Bathyarchaeota archaeon]|nr:site-specific integrase [Candidatus Bathyarchaeota archaeon]